MAKAYYNEIDPFAVKWLKNLIAGGHLPPGDVDNRSIKDVQGSDLDGYTQCHFFAGIGGWPYALKLVGVPLDWSVWTGSCPCQPFSRIGKRSGETDERHLWPDFDRLITKRKPQIVWGEQVASPDGYQWLDGVSVDMEAKGYAFWATDLSAAGVGAPHIRQRVYWVGHAIGEGLEGHGGYVQGWDEPGRLQASEAGPDTQAGSIGVESASVDAVHVLRRVAMHNPRGTRPQLRLSPDRRVGEDSVWDRFEALPCEDGWRRVRPGSFPMAHGLPERVGRLRGYGNAIVPQLAAEFIKASVEAINDVLS